MKFNELPLESEIMRGIEAAGFTHCTEVQEKTFKVTLDGRDVSVQSQTGTGKTAAFLITIFHLFLSGKIQKKRALIIVPTRELAVQIEKEAELLGRFVPFTIGSFYGGIGYGKQESQLRDKVNIVIGTPGRLIDFSSSGKLDLREFGILVIDEADRLFDMGFLPDLRKIVRKMDGPEDRVSMLFSATLTSRVRHLAWEYMHDPVEIEVSPENVTVVEVTQELYHVSKNEKMSLLLGIIASTKPQNALIFTNTKIKAMEIAERLKHNGYASRYIIGDLPQRKRLQVIDMIKSGELKFLVATDVAARGLHIQDLELVVNYDLPEDPENYVHRIGRTARAGKTGKAVSIACERYVYSLEAIEEFIGMKIPVAWPEDSLLVSDRSPRIDMRMLRDRDGTADPRDRRDGPSRSHSGRRDGQRGGQHGGRQGEARPSRPQERPSGSERPRPAAPVTSSPPKASASPPKASAASPKATSAPPKATPVPQRTSSPKAPRKPSSGGGKPVGVPRPQPTSEKNPVPSVQEKGRPDRRIPEAAKADRGKSVESRLDYYKKKYGEDFKPVDETPKREKKSFFRRIFGR